MRRISIYLAAVLALLVSSSCAQGRTDRYSQVVSRVRALDHLSSTRVLRIGKSAEGRPLYAVIITSPENPSRVAGDRARILFICGQHGDESSSVMAMTRLAEQLSQTTNPVHRAMLTRAVVAIVPVVNPDGFSRFRRQNALGADLNRNWTTRNQLETMAIQHLVSEFRPEIVVDEHEWLDGGPMRHTSVEVADFGQDDQYRLARLTSEVVTKRMSEDGVPLGTSHYRAQANPTLAHRHFARTGICSMLIETTPELSPDARARVYDSFAKELLLAVAFPPDPRISECLHGLSNWHEPMEPDLAAVIAPGAPKSSPFYPCAVLSIAFMMVLATAIGRGTRRQAEPFDPLAPRPIALTITDVVEFDVSPREKLGILRRYRSRPTDREDLLRKPIPNTPVLLDPSENRTLDRRWDSSIKRRIVTPTPSYGDKPLARERVPARGM
jgi:hypothetical protein